MKKTYIQPTMFAVVLQHSQIIAVSQIESNAGISDGGSSDGYQGPAGGAAKESANVWDEEW